MKKAVVLLSGGLDSTVCMAVAKSQGYETYPISFNYHQRHSIELEAPRQPHCQPEASDHRNKYGADWRLGIDGFPY